MRRGGEVSIRTAVQVARVSVSLARSGERWIVRTRYPAKRLDTFTLSMPLREARRVKRERHLYVALLALGLPSHTARRFAAVAANEGEPRRWWELVGPCKWAHETENSVNSAA
jgi:hypothetical protein